MERELEGLLHPPGNHPPSVSSFISALKQCMSNKDMVLGRKLHAQAIINGFAYMANIGTHLIHMFTTCGGTLLEGNLAFCCIAEPCPALTWHSILSSYYGHRENKCVISLFHKMHALENNIQCSALTFSLALKACCDLRALGQGRVIHGFITRFGVETNAVLRGGLITMYAKCQRLDEARCIFHKISSDCCNIILWGAMISGYVQHGHGLMALDLLEEMQTQGLVPDRSLFLSALKACCIAGAIKQGKHIHEQIVSMGLDTNVIIGSCLLDMYAKSGNLVEAQQLFDRLPTRNIVSWGALIAGYAQHGQGYVSLKLFSELLKESVLPDNFIYSSICKSCSSIGAINEGRCAHDLLIRDGVEIDINLGCTLLDLYAKWGYLEEMVKIFVSLPYKNVVSWNVLIERYADYGQSFVVLELLGKMQHEGIRPDILTFILTLKACGYVEFLSYGQLIHKAIILRGMESDKEVRSSLVNMYSKCGNLIDSQKVFDEFEDNDTVLFAAMICGYAQHEHNLCAFELYENMQTIGCKLNRVVLSNVLKLCTIAKQGRIMHEHIIKNGLNSDLIVASALVNMYAKCGNVEEAKKVLDQMPNQNIVPWNCMIEGYLQSANSLAAFECLSKIQGNGLHPDKITYLSLLRACGRLGALEIGKKLHNEIIFNGFDSHMDVATSLIHMYGKCGNLNAANRVFKDLPAQTIVSWNSMMAAYAQHGKHDETLQCLDQICEQGLKPKERTHATVLGVCSQIGRVKDGKLYFEVMSETYGIAQCNENINVLVDLLCRSGCLSEAEEVLCSISSPVGIIGLTSFLAACRTYGNVELGTKFFSMSPQ